jgi:hypothetical protein
MRSRLAGALGWSLLLAGACGGSAGKGTTPPVPPVSGTVASAAQSCADMPMPTTGTIYYACDCQSGADSSCKAGSDSNSGTDPAKPWQSYDKLQNAFNTMKAGDTVAFCRGGMWNGDTKSSWVNANCKADTPCTVRDYVPPGGASTLPLPKIVGASFNLLNNGNAAHEEGYQIMNLYMDGGPGYAISSGVQTGNDLSDVLVCNVTLTNYNIGVYNGNSNPPGPGSDGKNYRITVRGSQIFGNKTMGYLGTCNECALEYNVFDHNGTADPADHDIYLQAAADGNGSDYYATGERIVGNEVYHSSQGTGSTCKGDPIVVHGLHDGLLIANNIVSQDLGTAEGSCWGISVTKGYAHTEGFKNVTISGNVVKNVGNASIQLAYCQNCIVENNLIIQGQSGFDSSAIVAHYNGDIDPQDLPMNGVQILNNTIYMQTTSNNSSGIVVGLQGTGHVVANNVIVGSTTHMFSCLAYDLSASAYVSDYNYCWNLGGSVSMYEYISGTDLAAWQSKSGLDAHSNVADPMLKMPALTDYDFSPAAGSPLIGAAMADAATVDIMGNPRPSPADIGAIQH